MRNCVASLVLACLIILHADSLSTVKADEKTAATIYLPVYLEETTSGPTSFAAVAPSFDLQVLSSSPMSPTRPLLLIIDPSSYSMPQLHRRVTALVAALAAELPKQPSPRIRVGIPALNGILFDLPGGAGTLSGNIASAIMRLMPDTESEPENDPGRALDFVALLLQKAEADGGPVDCILVGKDRPFDGDNGVYVRLSAERRILELCRRKGSVVHSYLEGTGGMGSVCAATGGILFSGEEQAGWVIRQVLAAQGRGHLLAVQKKAAGTASGRFDLAIRAEDRAGNRVNLRAPAAIWRYPDDSPAPEYESVREALEWVGRAQRAAEGGDVGTAVRFIQNAVQMDPCNPDVFYFSAKYASEAGELAVAEAHVSKAMSFVPQTERVLVLYGEVFRKLGKSAEALATLESLPPGTAPTSAPFRLMVARLLSSAGRNEEAANLYADLTAQGQDTSQAHAEYGCLLWRLGKESAAAEQIRSALSADQQNVTAMLCSADMASAQGRLKEALETGSRAAKLRPEDPDIYVQIGKIHARAHQWESALASLQDAANLARARTDILLQLAEAEIESGQGREAVETMRRVLAINPSDASVCQQIAELFTRAGAFVNAATVLEESAARMPDKARMFYRQAAGLRERIEQYGQALLDYRALQPAPSEQAVTPDHDLSSHLAYLSLMVKSTVEHLGGAAGAGASPLTGTTPGIFVPGGVSLLGGMLGLYPATLKDAGATGKVLSIILDSVPSANEKQKLGPLQSEIMMYLQNYERLLRHMKGKGLLPASFDRAKRIEIVFPLVGDAPAVEQTKKFLGFFGVKYSLAQKGGKKTISLAMSQDAMMQQRQQLLSRMGVDIEAKSIRELRFSLGDEILPSVINAGLIQGRILGLREGDSKPLLARLIQRADAMKLYLALENCPAPLREALLRTFSGKELIPLAQILASFGRFLDFREGRLVLPGSEQAWENLVGASHSDPNAFLRAFFERGKGRLLYTYFALAYASPAVQRYFTASSHSLDELCNLIAPAGSGHNSNPDWEPELARLIRTVSADEHGLFLPVDYRFGTYLFSNRPKAGAPAGPGFSPLRISVRELASLVRTGGKSAPPVARPAGAGVIEFLEFLQDARPEILTDAAVEAIMRSPAESATYLDLIWDLNPPADLLVPYLAFCRELAKARDTGWNVNRTRTSQSIFFLISALCREKVIDTETGRKLLKTALVSLAAADETAFLFNVSEFLTAALLPALGHSLRLPADSPDLLEEALAGPTGQQVFLFGGAPIVQDNHTEQLQRIKSAIRQQRLASTPELLQAIQLTRKIQLSREPHFDWLQSFADKINKLPAPAPVTASSPNKDRVPPSPRSGYEDLVKELEVLSVLTSGGGYQARTPEVLKQAAAVLHAELGLTLLGHCYAYYATPQTAALSYDPDFIRKHDFYRHRQPSVSGWSGAELLVEQGKERAGAITGSLSGLGIQLHQLETAASAQSFGRRDWSKVVPAMLSGMRVTPQPLRTDQAQEYVALSVRLGRELLALCSSAPASSAWCDPHISALVSPLRRENIAGFLSRGDLASAVNLFSPSELFFLAEAYLLAVDALPSRACGRLSAYGCGTNPPSKAPEIASPALERLREIIPGEGSPESDAFQREVEQYGCSVWRRLGITDNSFRFCDSYEQLQDYTLRDLLFDRVIDVKIRLAETSYAAGVPASVGAMVGDLALQNLIADPASTRVDTWNDVMKEIARLGPGYVGGWMEELLNRGILSVYPGKPADKQEEF